jgi:hypothetical protein
MTSITAADGKSEMVVTLFVDEGWDSYLGHTTPSDDKQINCLLYNINISVDAVAICNIRKGNSADGKNIEIFVRGYAALIDDNLYHLYLYDMKNPTGNPVMRFRHSI